MASALAAQFERLASLASTVEVKRTVRGLRNGEREITIEAEYLDPAKATPEQIAGICSSEKTIGLACKLMPYDGMVPGGGGGCVYIVHAKDDPGYCKVGIAENPVNRLVGLQIGNRHTLSIASLFWIVRGNRHWLETLTHRVAKATNKHLHGEWLTVPPQEAALIVGEVAHRTDEVRVADSALWLRQREAMRLASLRFT
jgi:hypothetical protein